MRPAYRDIFLEPERFAGMCNLCGATVFADGLEIHSDWHERQDYEKWSKGIG